MTKPLLEYKLLKIRQSKYNDNTVLQIFNKFPNITPHEERFINQTYQTEHTRYLRIKKNYPNTTF